jgi:hypothetical protein
MATINTSYDYSGADWDSTTNTVTIPSVEEGKAVWYDIDDAITTSSTVEMISPVAEAQSQRIARLEEKIAQMEGHIIKLIDIMESKHGR